MNNKVALFFGLAILVLSACNKPKSFKLTPLNLAKYGVPLTIMAPDSAMVKKSEIGDWDDITVKSGEYSLQILGKKAPAYPADKIKQEELANIKADKFFSELLMDDDQGFVFETVIDSVNFYDFRYFHLQGDRVFTFQKGFTDNLSEDQAEEMYYAVKQKEK